MTIEEQNEQIEILIYEILQQCLVFDIETSAFYPGGEEINISSNFEDYVKFAEVRWIGCYSYRSEKVTIWNHHDKKDEILKLFATHKYLIGFNNNDFDFPILVNNGFIGDDEKYTHVDCMNILGASSFHTKKGLPFKGRGGLMDYDFPNNSLRTMAEVMGLETQKGDIDYKIFQKYHWTEQESKDIKKYLTSDVMATKQMFDKLISYWTPFCFFLPEKSIKDLSWVRGSIASMIYKCACNVLGEEPTYAEKGDEITEEKGGNVILPRVEEANGVYIIDVVSLYPHVFCLFNLCSEVPDDLKGPFIWHGNDVFKVKGYYETSRLHPLTQMLKDMLKKRIELKKTDPTNPMVYTLKIFVNGFYGVVRSKIFEKAHKPSAGWDCCWIGQQIQAIMESKMLEYGFETLAGDTDAIHVRALNSKNDSKEYVEECIQKIVKYISDNAPFKVDTFNIAIEKKTDYILYPHENQPVVGEDGKNLKEKNRLIYKKQPLKKNYLYIVTNKDGNKEVIIKGLPIIKSNATKLGYEIFNNVLKPKIKEQGHAKFDKSYIQSILDGYLQREDALDWISIEYKVKPSKGYKKDSQIHAQISRAYFGGGDGCIRLVKNSKIGKVGKGTFYCTIPEAIENKLTSEDIDLEKIWKELTPFLKDEL